MRRLHAKISFRHSVCPTTSTGLPIIPRSAIIRTRPNKSRLISVTLQASQQHLSVERRTNLNNLGQRTTCDPPAFPFDASKWKVLAAPITHADIAGIFSGSFRSGVIFTYNDPHSGQLLARAAANERAGTSLQTIQSFSALLIPKTVENTNHIDRHPQNNMPLGSSFARAPALFYFFLACFPQFLLARIGHDVP